MPNGRVEILHVVLVPHMDPKIMYYKIVIQCTDSLQASALKKTGIALLIDQVATAFAVISHNYLLACHGASGASRKPGRTPRTTTTPSVRRGQPGPGVVPDLPLPDRE
jgi:hypothetical protein